MLSTPPAFNLSQNQTLQFKSVQDSCFRRNRNLKDFLPTRYSVVNEPLWPLGPPTRLVAAQREERLCSLLPLKSTTFFRFAKVFRGDRQSFFSRREERLCSLLLSKSTTFFRFVKRCFTMEPVVFFNREEPLCSPSLQESTVFFRFREISFRLRFREPFSLVARSVYAPPRSTSQQLSQLSSNLSQKAAVVHVAEVKNTETPPRSQARMAFFDNL